MDNQSSSQDFKYEPNNDSPLVSRRHACLEFLRLGCELGDKSA